MKELSISYGPAQHALDFPRELSSSLELALIGEGSNQQNALETLDPKHQEFLRIYFMILLDKTYQGLQNPGYERGSLIFAINQNMQEFIHITYARAVLADVPNASGWAYPLTLSRAWTALDLALEAHRGIAYRDKRMVSLVLPNYYPTLVEMFEQRGLQLSDLEAEVLADMSEAAGAKEYAKVFGIAQDLVATIPDTRLGRRSSRPIRLGTDFVETVLSIRYTKPADA